MRIGIFHGIDTPPDYHYAQLAEQALGVPRVEVVELRWPSTGTVIGDVWKLMLDKSYREECIAESTRVLESAVSLDVIVGHSMGQVMMIEAAKRASEKSVFVPPMLSIGGPMSHPIWGCGLRAVGLGKPCKTWSRQIKMGWNADDIVPSWHGWQTSPEGFEPFQIAIMGSGRDEHPMDLYLKHATVREEIRGLRI